MELLSEKKKPKRQKEIKMSETTQPQSVLGQQKVEMSLKERRERLIRIAREAGIEIDMLSQVGEQFNFLLPKDKPAWIATGLAGAGAVAICSTSGVSIPATAGATLASMIGISLLANNREEAYQRGVAIGRKIRKLFRRKKEANK